MIKETRGLISFVSFKNDNTIKCINNCEYTKICMTVKWIIDIAEDWIKRWHKNDDTYVIDGWKSNGKQWR